MMDLILEMLMIHYSVSNPTFYIMINPWCMREGYGSRSVCVSVTKLAATYLVYTLKTRCH